MPEDPLVSNCRHCGTRIYQTVGAEEKWVHRPESGGEFCLSEVKAEPQQPPVLTPTQNLIMEVLAARYRLGEEVWTFESRYTPQVRYLNAMDPSLVDWKDGIGEKTILVWLTEKGKDTFLSATYEVPDQGSVIPGSGRRLREEKEIEHVSTAALSVLPEDELRALADIFTDIFKGNKAVPVTAHGFVRLLAGKVPMPPNGLGGPCTNCGVSNILCWNRLSRTTSKACCSTCKITDTHKGGRRED